MTCQKICLMLYILLLSYDNSGCTILQKGLVMNEEKEEILDYENVDILESVGSDMCESIRDLIYNVKEIKNDVNNIKEHLHL